LPLWSNEELGEILLHSARDFYKVEFGDKAEMALGIFYSYIKENHLNDTTLIDGAEEVIKQIKNIDVPMILVSNKKHQVLLDEVNHFGFKNYFQSVVGADKASRDKPHADPVLHAIELADIKLATISSAVFIGDTQTDVDCAKSLPFDVHSCIIGDMATIGHDTKLNAITDLLPK
jgi:phosphoglycolate phosphatase